MSNLVIAGSEAGREWAWGWIASRRMRRGRRCDPDLPPLVARSLAHGFSRCWSAGALRRRHARGKRCITSNHGRCCDGAQDWFAGRRGAGRTNRWVSWRAAVSPVPQSLPCWSHCCCRFGVAVRCCWRLWLQFLALLWISLCVVSERNKEVSNSLLLRGKRWVGARKDAGRRRYIHFRCASCVWGFWVIHGQPKPIIHK